MCELTFPLREMLQILHELRWELAVAKMSFHLQWKFYIQLCGCKGRIRGRVVAPTLKGPCDEDNIWSHESLQHWTDGKGSAARAPEAVTPSRDTDTPLVAHSHVRERARTHLALRKEELFRKAHFRVNWESATHHQIIDAWENPQWKFQHVPFTRCCSFFFTEY